MKCTAMTRTGGACGMAAVNGSNPPMCFNHASGLDSQRQRAREAGGKLRGEQQHRARKSTRAEVEHEKWFELFEPTDVEAALAHVAQEVLAGRMDARRAAAATKALQLIEPLVRQARCDRLRNGYYDDDAADAATDKTADDAESDA